MSTASMPTRQLKKQCEPWLNFRSKSISYPKNSELTGYREGKIKHIGLSEASSNTLRRACKIAPVAANQLEYSPFDRDIENEAGTNVLATCRELGVAVVCYSPLGRGLLTGAFTSRESVSSEGDYRGMMFPRFSEENIDANLKIVNQFKAFADKKGCTSSQLALAWLSKQGGDVIPNPGTKKIKYLEENWNSLNVHLSDAEEAEIRKFVEGAEIQGYRSTGASKTYAYVDTKEEV
jgi:aryl-alcohol dehydrogenase-like predicted oxidoreductase